MRDVLDEERGGLQPLSALLLVLAVVLGGMITFNAMFGQHGTSNQNTVSDASGAAAPTNTVIIKYDPVVEEVQRALVVTGIYNGLVDGVNGQRTKLAIEQYQQANGLQVDGQVSKDLATHIQYTNKLKAASEFTGSVDPAPQARPASPIAKPRVVPQVADEGGKSELPDATIKKSVSLVPAINAKLARIKKVQIALSSLGYKAGQVTGSLNEATKSAILQFEMDNGLSMDGVVDANLLQALQITANN